MTRCTCARHSGLKPAPEFEAWLGRVGIDHATPERIPRTLSPELIGLG